MNAAKCEPKPWQPLVNLDCKIPKIISLRVSSAQQVAAERNFIQVSPGWSISRILYAATVHRGCTVIIYLERASPLASCGLPETERRAASMSLLGLAPGGGYLASGITAAAGGLLHHLFTVTEKFGGLFLWPYPANYFAPGVTRHHALWSADFPRPRRAARHT
jgi:hypothetical protein